MARALSLDLRERVIAAIKAGASCGRAAERFGIAKASAIRWHARYRSEGEIAAKPMGGDRHSHRTEAHAALILQAYEARPQIYLREVRDVLEESGVAASLSGLSRFFRRHGITRKRMARPVGKRLLGSSLNCLHKRIRPSGEPLPKIVNKRRTLTPLSPTSNLLSTFVNSPFEGGVTIGADRDPTSN